MDFTNEQLSAINTKECDLLVSAAAGSGKTAVLVERIMSYIAPRTGDKEIEPVDIDRLLVVTFTDAAASEMRERIEAALIKRQEEEPENDNIHRQTLLVNKASISTIHSFCSYVIKKYFFLQDIEPNFKIADNAESSLLKAEILEQILERRYGEESEEFFKLADCLGGAKASDKGLSETVLKVYEFISNLTWGEEWLDDKLLYYKDVEAVEKTPWFKIIKDEIALRLESIRGSADKALEIAYLPNGPSQYIETLIIDKDQLAILTNVINADVSFEKMYETFQNFSFGQLSRKKPKNEVFEEYKTRAKAIRDNDVKKAFVKLIEDFFSMPPDDLTLQLNAMYRPLEVLCSVVKEFKQEYQLAKRERNIADYNDLEHFCLSILLDDSSTPENPVPSKAALELSQKFVEIMTDEYQDSNASQELILSLISRENPGNRFMVGDIKQSIYKFRRANPEIFIKKYNEYSKEENSPCRKIDLSKNFRSSPVVISFINFLFSQIICEAVGDISYDENAALYPGAQMPDNDGGKNVPGDVKLFIAYKESGEDELEVQISEEQNEIEELSKAETEARIIVNQIKEITEGATPLYIRDKRTGSYRRAELKDIVILSRSVKGIGEAFTNVFSESGIPLLTDAGQSYFKNLEVATMLSLLQVIDNPRQDVALITVLYSHIAGFNPDELLAVRQLNRDCPFYECLLQFAESGDEKAKKFIEKLEKWREKAIFMPISEILSFLYADTNYFNMAGVMPGGSVRQANLQALLEMAVAYEKTTFKGLFHFNKYMEKLQKTEIQAAEAKLISENDNTVKLMTIHKSKGLEFPIVFVCSLGKEFNKMDLRENIVLHGDLGFGAMFIDSENRVKSKTIAHSALCAKIAAEGLSEEMRMLYVALTRAKDGLYLVGSVNNINKQKDKWDLWASSKNPLFPAYITKNAKNFLDWLCPAVLRHGSGIAYYNADCEMICLNKESMAKAEETRQIKKSENYLLLRDNAHKYLETELFNQINKKLSWQYPHIVETKTPTKISISEIKRIYQKERLDPYTEIRLEQKPDILVPDFMKETKVAGARLGTLIHRVMENLDVHKHTDLVAINQLIESLVLRGVFTGEEADFIPRHKIEEFVTSSLADRMREAVDIFKETPFVMELHPYEIYSDNLLKDTNERVLVHGIIDLYFTEKNGGAVLVDYKSDKTHNINDIIERYKLQLNLYRLALQKSAGLSLNECFLYLFDINSAVHVEL